MMHGRHKRNHGFTLIELMIVMAIIVILAGIATALYTNSLQRSKEAVLKSDLFRMRDAIDQYYADKAKYPPSLEALVTEKYISRFPWIRSRTRPIPGRRRCRNPSRAMRPPPSLECTT
jgi:general secretion pathway protein G